jgi:hypothetical protein
MDDQLPGGVAEHGLDDAPVGDHVRAVHAAHAVAVLAALRGLGVRASPEPTVALAPWADEQGAEDAVEENVPLGHEGPLVGEGDAVGGGPGGGDGERDL